MSKLMKLDLPRHQVAIAGQVTDAQTGLTLGGVQVEITAAPATFTEWLTIRAIQHGDRWEAMAERPDRTRTAADGHFHFLDLPDGQYTLGASLSASGTRYATAQVTANVASTTSEGVRDITMASADIALPPTAVQGEITDQGSGAPILMARVRVQGSGERTFSDAGGKYLLAGLEVGERTMLVSAPGYQPAFQMVTFSQAGQVRTLDFALST